MARLSDFVPMELREIKVPSASRCISIKNLLEAGDYEETRISKSPSEIAESVLKRGGAGLSVAERKQLPNFILQSKFDEFQDEFAREVIQNYSKSDYFWHRLFRAWIREYNPKGLIGGLVVDALWRNLRKLPSDLRGLAGLHPILSRDPDFSGTARALLDNQISCEDRVALGLSERGVASTGLANRILVDCAKLLKSGDATPDQLRSFRRIVAPDNAIHESVQMTAMVGLILGAAGRSPSEEVVEDITKLVGDAFEDPMVRKDRWPLVTEDLGGSATRELCIDTVHKWQVFRSINFFFQIIEKVVDIEHKHQFPMRRVFWLEFFDQGLVTDAWVILGSKAEDEMRRILADGQNDYRGLNWGRLSGGRSDQCALLIRVGTATVMEFSHSGRVRMWGEPDKPADIPRLHRTEYQADLLRADCPPDQMFRHDSNGNWRILVADCIRRLTGASTKV